MSESDHTNSVTLKFDPVPACADESPVRAAGSVLQPHSVHDLRSTTQQELRYPATAILVFAGVPGAGKSTALQHLFGSSPLAQSPHRGPGDSLVLDSHHARNRWRRHLNWLPYPLWRPLVHYVHYWRIRSAIRDHAGPVIVHDCATYAWVRFLLSRWAATQSRELHMILIDVRPETARAGQQARGRRVNDVSFRLHCRRLHQLRHELHEGQLPSVRSTVLTHRAALHALHRISFTGASA